MKLDIWPTVQTERTVLAADLGGVSDERWSMPSLCDRWTVRDALAHMTATAKITPGRLFPKLAGSGFSFSRMQTKDIAAERGPAPADTLRGFEAIIASTKGPPGPPLIMMGETLLHSEDIRRPLGIPHTYPTEWLIRLADFYKSSNFVFGTKRRIAGLSLRATDADWSHGSGPEASGPMLSMLVAMTGRQAGLAELEGPGVDILRSR